MIDTCSLPKKYLLLIKDRVMELPLLQSWLLSQLTEGSSRYRGADSSPDYYLGYKECREQNTNCPTFENARVDT